MNTLKQNLLLADDDIDDCIFFKEALEDLKISVDLSIVHNGIELINFLLSNLNNLPDTIFLDLNMPRKTGLECLSEIKQNNQLKHIPIIIFSTSLNFDVTNLAYSQGATYYIRKPGEFLKLKKVIQDALFLTGNRSLPRPQIHEFIIIP